MTELYISKIKSIMSNADTLGNEDEIYLRLNRDKSPTWNFRTGTERSVRQACEFINGKARVELWDEDDITKDDKIGDFTVKEESEYKRERKTVTGEGSSYEIEYCIIP